ncbi:hypothetical protein H0W80_00830 [Candidatus Saccharibacteria bacterium]|nr:hypothetical protein [Candidatus Saccharibacteria bacterium]
MSDNEKPLSDDEKDLRHECTSPLAEGYILWKYNQYYFAPVLEDTIDANVYVMYISFCPFCGEKFADKETSPAKTARAQPRKGL